MSSETPNVSSACPNLGPVRGPSVVPRKPTVIVFVFGSPANDVRFEPVAAAIVTGFVLSIPFGAPFR